MWKLEDRGPMMIEPGCEGLSRHDHRRAYRDNDLEVNVLKGKQLTNIRTSRRTRPCA
jgi:GTP-binding protein